MAEQGRQARHGRPGPTWPGTAGTAQLLLLQTDSGILPVAGAPTTTLTTMSEFVYSDPNAEDQYGVDAQTAGEELQRIKRVHGLVHPATVVDESRPEDAPLHPAFEWRDPVAAERFREYQASQLIRRVRVVPVESDEPALPQAPRVQMPAPEPLELEEHDPLVWDLDQAVMALQKAKDQVAALKDKAARRFDRKRVIQAGVALSDLEQADDLLEDARESLTASRKASQWAGTGV